MKYLYTLEFDTVQKMLDYLPTEQERSYKKVIFDSNTKKKYFISFYKE